ncbi:MAG: hypothetical protein ACOX61_08830 [Brooklawnia sp.]|jgi:hypothetical protein
MSSAKQRLLIISFSPIHRDPRVLRQIALFGDDYDLTTCGFGTAPEGVVDHIEIPGPAGDVAGQMKARIHLVVLRRWNSLYESLREVRSSRIGLGERQPFDGVLANDVLALPLATSLGAPVHADLHEYAMGQGAGLSWVLAAAPFLRWAAGSITKCASVTTVAPGIADRYAREFGVQAGVVPNSPNHRNDLVVRPTGAPIRLVHVGAAGPPRRLELSVDAVTRVNQASPGKLELDLYLVPGSEAYIEQLRQQAGDASVTGVRLQEPVEFSQLIDVIHQYDVGLFFAPPVTYNLKHVLPNKFFEYVQARVGVVIGPSIEMAPYVDRYGFGAVARGWAGDDLVEVLQGLTPHLVDRWKAAADAAARELSADVTSQVWVDNVNTMMGQES